jgi:hypothetical protein
MKITRYAFGSIDVDGVNYKSDVIISPAGVRDRWWRRQGHRLSLDDLGEIERLGPLQLVIGTGYFGRMEVPPQTLDHLQARGIEVHIARTGDAVRKFNELQEHSAAVVAALHLTC